MGRGVRSCLRSFFGINTSSDDDDDDDDLYAHMAVIL